MHNGGPRRRTLADVTPWPGAGCDAAGGLRRMEPVGSHQRPHVAALQVPAPRHDAHVRPLRRRREAQPPAADPCAPPAQLATSLHLLSTPSLLTCCVQRRSAWSPGGVRGASSDVAPDLCAAGGDNGAIELSSSSSCAFTVGVCYGDACDPWSLSCAASSKLPPSAACGVCWRCGS